MTTVFYNDTVYLILVLVVLVLSVKWYFHNSKVLGNVAGINSLLTAANNMLNLIFTKCHYNYNGHYVLQPDETKVIVSTTSMFSNKRRPYSRNVKPVTRH